MSDAISVGPSLDILEDTPETPIVEVAPAKSSEDVQDPDKPEEDPEKDPSETPEGDKPEGTEDNPEDGDDPDKPGKPKKMGDDPEEDAEDGEQGNDADGEVEPVDVAKYTQEYYDNEGELSEESYADLEKRGFGKDLVDTFMAGIEALQTQRGEALHQIAGGKEAYDALVAYGAKNLNEAERAAFDAAVDQAIIEGDRTSVSLLIPGIKARMQTEPNYVEAGDAGNTGSIQPFANKTEMMEAMRDPRYRKDGQYVAQVQQRLAISTF